MFSFYDIINETDFGEEMIDARYHQQLALLFSPTTINALCNGEQNTSMRYILQESYFDETIPPNATIREVFDAVYRYLVDNYRNEYVYKNAIANKILLGRHSLRTSHILNEFRVGDSKADLVILNGTSHVYEIKTEYDTTERLAKQINNYLRVFDQVHVVVHEKHVDKAREIVDEKVGLMVLTKRYSFKTIREATSNTLNVVPEIIFESLRRPEYCWILKKELGYVPDVPNTKIYTECRKLFSRLKPETTHDGMVSVLKKRNDTGSISSEMKTLPQSITMALLSCKIRPNHIQSLEKMLLRVYH